MSDVLAFLRWWVVVELFGLAALPLAFRLLRWLPDRGYALAKPLGLLLSGYIFWLLVSLGFMRNTAGGIVAAMVIVAAAGLWWHSHRSESEGGAPAAESMTLGDWLRSHRALIIASELLFLLAFAGWTVFRAYNPEIAATEKPMEFAFLNSTLRSPAFPPLDPWMSGFAISYYYFGYVLVAMLVRLTGVPSAVGFNLAIALLFALTATGGFSAVYNLVASVRAQRNSPGSLTVAIVFGLLGALLLVGIGNWEGMLEVLHNNGVGPAGFWKWLDIQEINVPPPARPSWPPRGGWWWWRASRVIHDYAPSGGDQEAIDEFPFFSFLLGDMHPHVLALPFVLLALGLGLNLFLRTAGSFPSSPAPPSAQGSDKEFKLNAVLRRVLRLGGPDLAVYAIVLGGLSFLNTWDFPIYWSIVVGGYGLARLTSSQAWEEGPGVRAAEATILGLLLGLGGALLYLPFYIGFQTQASGLLPTLVNVTRLPQYLVMFGVFFVPIIALLAVVSIEALRRGRLSLRAVFVAAGCVIAILLVLLVFAGLMASRAPEGQTILRQGGGWAQVAALWLGLRVRNPWLLLMLLAVISLVAGLVHSAISYQPSAISQKPSSIRGGLKARPLATDPCSLSSPILFGLLLIAAGALLTLAPDFVYIRDNFGYRINTIFKFYYQGWVLFAVAAAFATYLVGQRWQQSGRLAFGLAMVVAMGMALAYPLLAMPDKADGFAGQPTLNGLAAFEAAHPDDMAAIRWMEANVPNTAVVLEAVRPSYDPQFGGPYFSQVAGYPTVLGWPFHEVQWRGTADRLGSREADVKLIYQSPRWGDAEALLRKYHVDYVVVGPMEQGTYGSAGLAKFKANLPIAFQQGQVVVYRVPPDSGG